MTVAKPSSNRSHHRGGRHSRRSHKHRPPHTHCLTNGYSATVRTTVGEHPNLDGRAKACDSTVPESKVVADAHLLGSSRLWSA